VGIEQLAEEWEASSNGLEGRRTAVCPQNSPHVRDERATHGEASLDNDDLGYWKCQRIVAKKLTWEVERIQWWGKDRYRPMAAKTAHGGIK
jgi:hypothetical protein